jgi:hypothetical protein
LGFSHVPSYVVSTSDGAPISDVPAIAIVLTCDVPIFHVVPTCVNKSVPMSSSVPMPLKLVRLVSPTTDVVPIRSNIPHCKYSASLQS